MDFPLDYVRGCFPDLDGSDTIYMNNLEQPRPLRTVQALTHEAPSETEGEGHHDLLNETRASLAGFLNSNEDWADEEILIAPDADELARRLSHALAEESGNGARIVLTEIDEERALTPWASLADDGFEIEFCPVKRPRAGLDVEQIRSRLTDATSAVVVPKACAAAGTVIELLPIVLELQSRPGSMVIDWTSFLPHGAVDVRFLRCDFFLASTKSFFGADVGFLWGKKDRMAALRRDHPEFFRGLDIDMKRLAGLSAALRHVEELGILSHEMQLQPSEDYGRRRQMRRGMQSIRHYERSLTALALRRLASIPGVRVFGIDDPDAAAHRIPNILFRVEGCPPAETANALAERAILVSHGDCGSPRLAKALGIQNEGGVSVSFMHYNSEADVEQLADALHDIVPAV